MGRSRVYCTRPANANRQHNVNTARPIPWKTAPQQTVRAAQRMCHLTGYPTAPAYADPRPVTWASNAFP
jgi:hypothetical protein